jgi:hypothetical protein
MDSAVPYVPYRGPNLLITEARLLAMAPEAVEAALKDYATSPPDPKGTFETDEKTEQALEARNEPLITLALARYGRDIHTAIRLFQAAAPSSPVRLGILSNSFHRWDVIRSFPVGIFGGKEETAAWIETASHQEVQALFRNPKLHDRFLGDLLEGCDPYGTISDQTMRDVVSYLATNERMRTPYDERFPDAMTDFEHHMVFKAAWGLAERVPTTVQWANVLTEFFNRICPDGALKEPLAIANRWVPDPTDEKELQEQDETRARGYLSPWEGVRKGLGRLELGLFHRPDKPLVSDDRAIRATAYAHARMSATQLTEAAARDGSLVVHEALDNEWIWRSSAGREALHDLAWAEKDDDLISVNWYNRLLDRYQKTRPEWFKDEEETERGPKCVAIDDESIGRILNEVAKSSESRADVVVSIVKTELKSLESRLHHDRDKIDLPRMLKAELQELEGGLRQDRREAIINEVKVLGALKEIKSRVGWVGWFALGALAASLVRLL